MYISLVIFPLLKLYICHLCMGAHRHQKMVSDHLKLYLWTTLYGWWKVNLGPFEEQQFRWATESLQPYSFALIQYYKPFVCVLEEVCHWRWLTLCASHLWIKCKLYATFVPVPCLPARYRISHHGGPGLTLWNYKPPISSFYCKFHSHDHDVSSKRKKMTKMGFYSLSTSFTAVFPELWGGWYKCSI